MKTQYFDWKSLCVGFFGLLLACVGNEGVMGQGSIIGEASTTLTLEASETAAAPGDSIFAFGDLFVATDPPQALGGRTIEIEVTAPDTTSVTELQILTNEDGRFVVIIDNFSQQGTYTIDAFFAGEFLESFLFRSASASTDVAVTGDIQLRSPIENLGVFTSVPFRWEAFQGRSDLFYDLTIALDPDFEQIVQVLQGLETTSALLTLATQTPYYWRVDVFEQPFPGAPLEFITVSALASFITSGGDGFAGIVTGLVTSNAGATKIESASVETEFVLTESNQRNSADQLVTIDGIYIFHTLDTGTKNITVRHPRYRDEVVSVTVPLSDTNVTVTKDVDLTLTSPPPVPGTFDISGLVTDATAGTPLGALVLANGKFVFTPFNAESDSGRFFLRDVPLDPAGKITLFAFADNYAPFDKELSPGRGPNNELSSDAQLVLPPSDVQRMEVDHGTEVTGPNRVTIRGSVRDENDGAALGALILANGEQMFTQVGVGTFELPDVPLDPDVQITLFAFAFGFAPYKEENITP